VPPIAAEHGRLCSRPEPDIPHDCVLGPAFDTCAAGEPCAFHYDFLWVPRRRGKGGSVCSACCRVGSLTVVRIGLRIVLATGELKLTCRTISSSTSRRASPLTSMLARIAWKPFNPVAFPRRLRPMPPIDNFGFGRDFELRRLYLLPPGDRGVPTTRQPSRPDSAIGRARGGVVAERSCGSSTTTAS